MIIRFKDKDGSHKILTVSKLEIENVHNTIVKKGRWIFKDTICSECFFEKVCEEANDTTETCEWFKVKKNEVP